MQTKLRVGAVSYMNTKPLVWGLDKRKDIIDLCFEVPSKLGRMFDAGLLDAALLPTIKYFENDNNRVIPDISIAAKSMVESVNLFVKGNIKDIKKVALDTSSLTSRALTSVILSEQYGLKPDITDWENGMNIEDSDSDAVLLIGDNAMKVKNDQFEVVDLANEWFKLTNLPFVFAVWVTKCGTKLNGVDKILKDAKENGLKAVDEIAAIESKRLGFSKEDCVRYLTKSITYDLGKSEINGLEKFYYYSKKLGLINQKNPFNRTCNFEQESKTCIKFYTD